MSNSAEAKSTPIGRLSDWDDNDWEALLLSIQAKKCTPFLGAGACWGILPLGREIAAMWAQQDAYPFEDKHNLVKVAQYVATMRGAQVPKLRIQNQFAGKLPDFDELDEPHRVVADLALPIYITTNYDDFMFKALKRVPPGLSDRTPSRHLCQWHLARRGGVQKLDLAPTVANPVVYHFHGNFDDINSLVLTEDDYLEFLAVAIQNRDLIPSTIEQVFGASAFLFLGYSLEDLNFKVLFRKLATYLGGNSFRHVAVQLTPRSALPVPPTGIGHALEKSESDNKDRPDGADTDPKAEPQPTAEEIERVNRQRDYLEKQYGLIQVKVYWGTCRKFSADLSARWRAFSSPK